MTGPSGRRSATSSGRPRRSGAGTAVRWSRRRPGSWPRRSGIGRRVPAIRSCTRTCSSRTSARGSDGRWSALDGRRLYAHARAASFIYQAVLRAELTRTVGVEWTPVRGGIAEVVGVPRAVREAFSRRRAEIEAALEERGTSGPRAAEAAALATRREKDVSQRRRGPRSASGGRGRPSWGSAARSCGASSDGRSADAALGSDRELAVERSGRPARAHALARDVLVAAT